uniref:Myb/SANT-like DNA-binding domain-containing protein n=1 Tax=Oryzias melastigma TaxID=30732 RepID=A0A3B3BM90_ORYME
MLSQNKMHNWQENEIKELLLIRGSEAIRGQITGTVKDSVVYSRMTKLLAERGVHRTHMQVISKLKALRKQATVMDQVSTLVSATVAQLREMDAAMQAQEDARLQRLMNHEREMQNSLMSQLVLMNERISRENHERNLQLVDRILSRFPSASSSH